MGIGRFKKGLAALVALALTLSAAPATVLEVKAEGTTQTVIYSNDFEDASKLPEKKTAADLVGGINGSTALGFDYTFDKSKDWDQKDIQMNYQYADPITAGAKLSVDVILPKDGTYNGTLKLQAATQLGANWAWTKATEEQSIDLSKFVVVGDYKVQTIQFTFGDEIASIQGLNSIIVQVVGNYCDYNGKVLIDNVKLIDGVAPSTNKKVYYTNDFESSTKLPENSSLVSGINGSTVLGFDYTFDKGQSWDQRDIEFKYEYADPIVEGAKLSVDVILPKDATYDGTLALKAATQMGPSPWTWTEAADVQTLALDKFTTVGDYKVQTLTFTFGSKITEKQGLHGIFLQTVGKNCNYAGKFYIDNIKLIEGEIAAPTEKYVLKTVEPTAQTKVEPSKLNIPSTVSLIDSKSIANTANLYAYLKAVGESDYLIFGHQNDLHSKAGSSKLSKSDTMDMTGSISGVVGIDSLSLTGAELQVPDGDPRSAATYVADLSEKAAKQGAIITLSMHMPNFDLVKEKGKKKDGKWDFTGYTPNTTTGNVMQRILPGGDLNEVFTSYMDIIADYANQLEARGIPVLFRPFHENSGGWFWWGSATCDQAGFRNVWRYTVDYMRDVKDTHNLIYVYSPNGTFENEASYLDRYPGDEYVDVMAMDLYNQNPTLTDNFPTILADNMKMIDGIAAKHNKVTAVSEAGILCTGFNGMKVTGNKRVTWFEDVLNTVASTNAAYLLTWANFGETSGIFMPYMADETHGHEMLNSFIKFYNDEKSVFADGVGDFSSLNVTNTDAYTNTTGFMVAPTSGSRMLEASKLQATVKNTDKEVSFVLKNSDGVVIKTLKAAANGTTYTAQVTDEILKAIAPTFGTIDLTVGGQVYDTVKVMFNIKEVPVNPAMGDDFEYYYGNDDLLGTQWSTNFGPGCSITPMTTNKVGEHNNGEYGVAFKYKISTEKASEGWAGMTKNMGKDWSPYDALQIWIKPDGYGQKLVVQITSKGEDFEVHLPEFAATKEAKLLTIPFSKFVGKNKGIFDPKNIDRIGVWCNTIIPEGQAGITVDSTMYIDDIKAVKTNVASGAQDLLSKLEAVKDTEIIFTPDSDIIPVNAFKLAKQNNNKILVVKDKVSFKFDDKAVLDTIINSNLVDLKLISKVLKNDTVKKFIEGQGAKLLAGYSFENNLADGKFGGKVNMNIKVDPAYTGKKLFVYFVDKNSKYKLVDSPVVAEGGDCTVYIEHFSDYVVTDKELDLSVVNPGVNPGSNPSNGNGITTTLPQTGSPVDKNVLLGLGALILLAGAAVVGLARRKERE